jgi:hypothetical protein
MTQRTLILATGLILAAAMMVSVPAVRAVADTNPAVRKVDQSFVQAVAKNDPTAIGALLDVDSTGIRGRAMRRSSIRLHRCLATRAAQK